MTSASAGSAHFCKAAPARVRNLYKDEGLGLVLEGMAEIRRRRLRRRHNQRLKPTLLTFAGVLTLFPSDFRDLWKILLVVFGFFTAETPNFQYYMR